MKLANNTDVTTRMGSNAQMGNIGTAADSVLEAATPIIENILGTPLVSADRTDWFSYDPSMFETDYEIQFNLTQSFIEGAVSVYYSNDGKPVLSDFSNAEVVAAADMDVDEEKGVVIASNVLYKGTSVVAMKYSAGFTEGSADIPDWLKESAISAAVRVIHSQTLGHNKNDITKVAPELHRIFMMTLNDHIRPRLHGIFPSRTKVL